MTVKRKKTLDDLQYKMLLGLLKVNKDIESISDENFMNDERSKSFLLLQNLEYLNGKKDAYLECIKMIDDWKEETKPDDVRLTDSLTHYAETTEEQIKNNQGAMQWAEERLKKINDKWEGNKINVNQVDM